jgi:hypothetical protein
VVVFESGVDARGSLVLEKVLNELSEFIATAT